MKLKYFPILLFVIVVNSYTQTSKPKNVILLIGDGMGINYVGASLLQDKNSPFNNFNTIGLSITCSADKLITDSAAGATALATGFLTNNKYVSVDTSGQNLYTIFEHAEKLGLLTGLVVTGTVTHATPGAFVGHSISRYDQELIAKQMVDQEYDVIIGGGLKYFLPFNNSGAREDQNDLTEILKSKSYQMPRSFDELTLLPPTANKVYALLEKDGLPGASQRNYSLGDLTRIALKKLDNDSTGFFLMVEGSQIDWAGHDHKSKELFDEMNDFSLSVAEALKFAREDGNTLVVVTADHETGGIAITDGNFNDFILSYASTSHTASPVGIFAFGPGEEMFMGIMNINQIGQKLFKAIDPSYNF